MVLQPLLLLPYPCLCPYQLVRLRYQPVAVGVVGDLCQPEEGEELCQPAGVEEELEPAL